LLNFFHYKRERRLNTWLTSSTTRGREGKPLDLLLPLLEGEKAQHLVNFFTTRGREGKPLDLLFPLLEKEKASHLVYSFH